MQEIVNHAISADGSLIGYRQLGSGEGLIICHGAGRISQNYRKLAAVLANHFTVYIPDRRGRGLTAAVSADYGLKQATEDLQAVIKATQASYIFGHSAGGVIALETMLEHPVKKLALYDPPISVDHSVPSQWLQAFDEALNNGRRKKAMTILLRGTQAHEGMVNMPQAMLMLLVNLISLLERKKEKGTRMIDLLHTVTADMQIVAGLDSQQARYRQLSMTVLLMAGANSQHFFQNGVTVLEKVLLLSQTKIFPGFDHYSPEEKVGEIAAALVSFFSHS